MPTNDYANAGDQSRAERILSSIINDTEYDEPVQSRLEYLLLQLLGTLDGKADLDENGLIPVSEIPPQAFEYMVDVENDTARFALTTDDVQKGDIVRVISTGIMYIVVDDMHLSTEAGYKPFAAGIAAKAIGDEDGNNIKQTYQTKIDANNKLPADNIVLTGYAVDDSRSNITASSSVRDAVEQLEYREEFNKNNISSIPRTDMDKLPITFTTNTDDNLKGYTIFGNADKVGEQTVNLFDKSNADIRDSVYPDGTTGEVKTTSFVYTVTIQCEPSTTYTISKNTTARRRLAGYNTYPQVGDIAEFVTETYTTIGSKQAVTFTTTSDTHYLLFFFSASELTTEVLQEIIYSIQLELGSTMTDYEPYGYKIPITCGGVTTNIYCDSQLDKGDMLTLGESEINIPVLSGSNTITTTLTNKPIMWIKYE